VDRVVKVNRLVLLAVVGAVTFSLTGCDELGDNAAVVGDQTVTTSDVDFLTSMQCTALDAAADDPAQAGQVQAVARKEVRAAMANALIQVAVNEQIAAEGDGDYDRAAYRAQVDNFEGEIAKVPAEDRERYRDLVSRLFKSQAQVLDLIQKRLAAGGVTDINEQVLNDAFTALQTDFRKDHDVDVNPVYGPDAAGNAGTLDPSLSRAVSDYAKSAAESSPPATFVNTLPKNMRCGG
jgi:hypothetical protein